MRHGWLPTNRQSLQREGFDSVFVMGDTVDLPISKGGGRCHNQSPVICDNIAGLLRLGKLVAGYDGKVQAIAQMGFRAGMPRWYSYDQDVVPLPAAGSAASCATPSIAASTGASPEASSDWRTT